MPHHIAVAHSGDGHAGPVQRHQVKRSRVVDVRVVLTGVVWDAWRGRVGRHSNISAHKMHEGVVPRAPASEKVLAWMQARCTTLE
jgi:hypothetical protein